VLLKCGRHPFQKYSFTPVVKSSATVQAYFFICAKGSPRKKNLSVPPFALFSFFFLSLGRLLYTVDYIVSYELPPLPASRESDLELQLGVILTLATVLVTGAEYEIDASGYIG